MNPEGAAGPASGPGPAPGPDPLVARLGDISVFDLELREVHDLSRSVRRLRFSAAGLDQLSYEPGQDLMLTVASDGEGRVRRRYTIRRLDRASGAVDLDFVLHGDGPAARWAATARPGDRLEAAGPRGKITLDPSADWHLFAGDESFLGAAGAMLAALDRDEVGAVVLEVGGADDEVALELADGSPAPVTYVHRLDAPPGSAAVLADALRRAPLPSGAGRAYIGAEVGVAAALRQLLVERGLPGDAIAAKGYWRLGQSNARHGEPARD